MPYTNIMRCHFTTDRQRDYHLHQDIEIICVIDGSLELTYGGQKQVFTNDQFILINSNIKHSWHSDNPLLLGIIHIDYARLCEYFQGEQVFFYCNSTSEHSDTIDKIRYYIKQIFSYSQAIEGQGQILRNGLYFQLLYLLTTDCLVKRGMQHYDSLRGIQDERLNEIISFITRNYHLPLTLQELADRLYLSPTYLSRYIKQSLGMSFLNILNNIRLDFALRQMTTTDDSITKIAMDNGFPNLASFNKTFRKIYNMTPAQYRKNEMETGKAPEHVAVDQTTFEEVEQYLTSNLVPSALVESHTSASLEVDNQAIGKLNRNWGHMINIGQASDLLRYDVRRQVLYLKEKLGFEYVRFWNIWSQDLMISLTENRSSFNFNVLDQIFDFLLENDLHPYIELGFKTNEIFENPQNRIVDIHHSQQIEAITQNPAFFTSLIKHLTLRYGEEKLAKWCIELEKDHFGQPNTDPEKYVKAFATIYSIFKTYVPGMKIGGAGFLASNPDFNPEVVLEQWHNLGIIPDFISIHVYPYLMNPELIEPGRTAYAPDEHYLKNQIMTIKEMMDSWGFQECELHVSEWSSTLSNRNVLNDGCFKGAYMMNNLISTMDDADMIGYWIGTDIFSNYYDSNKLLFGGCGLISKDGIRKPSFYALNFLNLSEKYVIGSDRNSLITSNGKSHFAICCHNYKHFNFRYYLMKENEIQVEQQERLYEDNERRQIHYKISGVSNGTYLVKTYSISTDYGNIQKEWAKIGHYNELSPAELRYLNEITQPKIQIEKIECLNHSLEIDTTLNPQEIRHISITPI